MSVISSVSLARAALSLAASTLLSGCVTPAQAQLQPPPQLQSAPAVLAPKPMGEMLAGDAPKQWTYPESATNGWPDTSCEKPVATQQQSPIDFTKLPAKGQPGALIPAAATVVQNASFDPADQNVVFGPTIGISPVPGSSAAAPAVYTLVGSHFHWTAEHVIPGTTAAAPGILELHMKAKETTGNNYAVFSVIWVDTGVTNMEAQEPALLAAITSLASYAPLNLGPALMNFTQQPFYSYLGSLTTPPCTPNIRWYVLANPLKANGLQLAFMLASLRVAGLPTTTTGAAINFRKPQPFSTPLPAVYLVTPTPRPNWGK